MNVYLKDYPLAFAEILISITGLIVYLRVRKQEVVGYEILALATLYSLVVLYAVFSSHQGSWIALWIFTLPPLYHVLFNRFVASVITGSLLTLVFIFFSFHFIDNFSYLKLLNFSMPYILVWAISFKYESLRIKVQEKTFALAETDPLTSIGNRLALKNVWKSLPIQHGVYLLYFDIDDFKNINDMFGHDVGDDVIKYSISQKHFSHSEGRVFRLGGEEFCWIFLAKDRHEATQASNKVRTSIMNKVFLEASGDFSITVSGGLVRVDKDEWSLDQTLSKADALLYEAKSEGKNRINVGFSLL